ncbi:MAG: hypothetical protein HQ518_10995 [Rhodopirellula sp.]|nr:hypothetical protein [Rhodopirellula sp.]
MPANVEWSRDQKSGCGKSSLCLQAAGALVHAGTSVLLVDEDPQGTLRR